ncbi:MAG TPA: hypothetical protein PLZ79_12765, partial [Burkholderiales bacterium]|nr:hypothetical protein [Burkholderiales bacterium]
VARVYVDLGIPRLASQYAGRQLQALQEQKADGDRIAKAQMLLAEAAMAENRDKDAEDYLLGALQSLPHNSALVPDALARLAQLQQGMGKLAEAKQNMKEGYRLLAERGIDNSVAFSRLRYLESVLLSIDGEFGRTDKLVDEAIKHALKVEGPLSATAIGIRMHRARMLIANNRPQEAFPLRDAALSAWHTLGGVHELRAALATADMQQFLAAKNFASYPETLAVLRDVQATLDSYPGPIPVEVRAEIEEGYGAALLNSGDIIAALPLLLRSSEVLGSPTQTLWRQLGAAGTRGDVNFVVGNYAAADEGYRQAIRVREAMGLGGTVYIAEEMKNLARSLTLQGRPEEALAFLATAPEFAKPDELPQRNLLAYERAFARFVAGDTAGALKLLPEDAANQLRPGYVELGQLRGEILCAAGDRPAGLQFLQRGIAEHLQMGINNQDTAHMRAIAGLCALELGERKQAEQWAASARSYFEAQPTVASYYKKPLVELEKRLAEGQLNGTGTRRVNPTTRTQLH